MELSWKYVNILASIKNTNIVKEEKYQPKFIDKPIISNS